ncbi:MAG: hypothetical protein JNL41_01165 [Phenylobacterium sp.]|uniref:hypothetical protein n=1 Tax=Phenylobacterium sp. TaxID=1871053 RepID=UPI001A4636DB|nr:hypothetical protein [Phenylobacterium sp.]MBL8552857.1 hypothetical protein [Phenylobacterium sp.]
MRIAILTTLAALALTACASTGGGKLAVCDGKHLRPANPYGSVLAVPAEGVPPAPPAAPEAAKPKTLSSNTSPTSFGSCLA